MEVKRKTLKDKYQDNLDFMAVAQPILNTAIVKEMKQYRHHGHVNCLEHSVDVAFVAYKLGVVFKLDKEVLIRAGLLHDLYLYDWHIKGERKGFHGMTHARVSLKNALQFFDLNKKTRDAISCHMWPLNLRVPRYKESWILMLADRYCALVETFRR